jgi:hypothetical protein
VKHIGVIAHCVLWSQVELLAGIDETLAPGGGGGGGGGCSAVAAEKGASPEEVAQRRERITAMALRSLAALAALLPPGGDGWAALRALLATKGFWRTHLTAASSGVRRAGYDLVKVLCGVADGAVLDDASTHATLAPLVLGAFMDKECATHPALWAMVRPTHTRC